MANMILVVDDDKFITFAMKKLIENTMEAEVITYTSPFEALNAPEIAEGKIDLVISDFMMPSMNGLQFLRSFKEISPNSIRILLTGYTDKENAIACINEVGLYYYMEKPWDNTAMVNIIKNALEKADMFLQIQKKNIELRELNKTLEQRISNRVAAVRNLLNNITQGLFTIKTDQTVDIECSAQCLKIFEENIAGKEFSKLLYPNDEEKQTFVENTLNNVFQEKNLMRRDVFISLLPDNVKIGQKDINIEYKIINSRENTDFVIMVILNDITEKNELQSIIEDERRHLKMVIGFVVDSVNFVNNINEYTLFCNTQIDTICSPNEMPEKVLSIISMKIHTFKGIFGLMEMVQIENRLHDLENELSDYKKKNPNFSVEDIKEFMTSRNMITWMDDDLNALKETLGKDVFSKEDTYEVKKSTLEKLKIKIEALSSEEEKELLLKELKKITYVPFLKLINEYDKYIYKLGEKTKKLVNPIKIEGGHELVDYHVFSEFARSLVHIFRNTIEHGIELPDARIAKNKSEFGSITFKIWQENNNLCIIIADDGNGIDQEKIKQKALTKGFIKNEDLLKLSNEDINNLIFKPDISTHEEISKFAGRGIGLFSVFQEVQKLGGNITVDSILGEGTTFKFIIPND